MRFILYTGRESAAGNRIAVNGMVLCSTACAKTVADIYLNNVGGETTVDYIKFVSSPLANCTRCYNCSHVMPCENDSPRAQVCLMGDECHRYPTLTDTLGMEE